MTTEELEKIVTRHEMQSLELKESFGVECIETACAFANAHGGHLVIGVDDDGAPSTHELRGESLRDYENRISTATEPCVAVDAEKVAFRGRDVVVLKVMENPLKPVAFKGRCYMRKGSVNHQMTPTEIVECHLKCTGSSMDAVFVPNVTKDDLDLDVVRRYMRKATSENRRAFANDEDPWRVLLKLGLVISETQITRAAYLLFAKFPQQRFSQAMIHSGAFKAEGAVIVDSHDSYGNIQDQVEDALSFILKNIHCALVVSGKVEHDRVWDYPVEALREALANAVCHRDYGIANNIQVKVFENRVVIMNPGQLPFDMSLEDLENPDHPSRPRNKLIAQVFYDLHVIEQYGSGIRRIKDACAANGNPAPILMSEHGAFTMKFLIRTNGTPNSTPMARPKSTPIKKDGMCNNFSRSDENVKKGDINGTADVRGESTPMTGSTPMAETSSTPMTNQKDNGRDEANQTGAQIVALVKERGSITINEISEALGLSYVGVRKAMRKLQKQNVIRRVGPNKTGHWEVCN